MKLIANILILLICTGSAYSQNFYSLDEAMDWTTQSAWSNTSGGVPCTCSPPFQVAAADSVFIETNVTLYGSIRLKANSALVISAGDTLWITVDAQFDNGSYVFIEEGGALIITGDLDNSNNSDQVIIDGFISVGGDFSNGNGAALTGNGEITVTGTIDNSGTIGGSTTDDLTDGTLGDGSYLPPALPIELIEFTTEYDDEQVIIMWTTATELNNDYFVVQRTIDAVHYQDLEVVDGAGNSNTVRYYNYTDFSPYDGTAYYRIKQVDFDGTITHTRLLAVSYKDNSGQPSIKFRLYPNPCIDRVNIESTSEYYADSEILVVLCSMNGKQYHAKIVVTDSQGQYTTAIDLCNNVPSGLYVVLASSNDDIHSEILIIE